MGDRYVTCGAVLVLFFYIHCPVPVLIFFSELDPVVVLLKWIKIRIP